MRNLGQIERISTTEKFTILKEENMEFKFLIEYDGKEKIFTGANMNVALEKAEVFFNTTRNNLNIKQLTFEYDLMTEKEKEQLAQET